MKNLQRLTLVMLMAVSACSQKQGSSSSSLKIINGGPVDASSPAYTSAVKLELGGALCTGTVIAPRLVLTAAHCVADTPAEAIAVTFDKLPVGNPLRTGRVQRVRTFKPFGAERFPNFDVAYLELKSEVPAPYTSMEILRDGSRLTVDTPILLAGFGNQKDDCQSESCVGSLRETKTQFRNYYDRAHIMSLLVFHGVAAQDLGSACNGDSGGPAYAQVGTKWYLVGITNGLRSDIVPESDGTCAGGWDIYTFAGDYTHWLESDSRQALKSDSLVNPPPSIPPRLVSGPSETQRPSTWAEWVTYANHEDPSWYTVDTVLQSFVRSNGSLNSVTGGAKASEANEMLYAPERTEALAASVQRLVLAMPSVGDLAPLKSFAGLKELYLQNTSIRDLSPLSGLSNLTVLSLRDSSNQLPSEFFNSLGDARATIQTLIVEAASADAVNGIDWTAFGSLKSVSFAHLDGVLDLSQVKPRSSSSFALSLASAETKGTLDGSGLINPNLWLADLVDIEGHRLGGGVNWSSFMNLESLDLRGLGREEIPDLKKFKALKSLGLARNNLASLADLSLPSGLMSLDVSGNALATLGSTLENVNILRAYDNPLTDVSCPARTCFKDVHVSPLTFNDYCENAQAAQRYGYSHVYLPTLRTIQEQSLGASRLSCEGLAQIVPRMRYLALSGSGIKDIRPLQYMPQVQYLILDDNELSDLNPIASMRKLEYLSVAGNQVRELPSLSSLLQLSDLNISRNPLSRLTLDGPELRHVAFGRENSPRILKNFSLSVAKAKNLESLELGGVELDETSQAELHDAFTLRFLNYFDGQLIDAEDFRDMVSLNLASSKMELDKGCEVINGSCAATALGSNAEGNSVLGPMLGTTRGSRAEVTGPVFNLPGLPFAIQTN
jgi:Leucine-rich repeat (LRR) protein